MFYVHNFLKIMPFMR